MKFFPPGRLLELAPFAAQAACILPAQAPKETALRMAAAQAADSFLGFVDKSPAPPSMAKSLRSMLSEALCAFGTGPAAQSLAGELFFAAADRLTGLCADWRCGYAQAAAGRLDLASADLAALASPWPELPVNGWIRARLAFNLARGALHCPTLSCHPHAGPFVASLEHLFFSQTHNQGLDTLGAAALQNLHALGNGAQKASLLAYAQKKCSSGLYAAFPDQAQILCQIAGVELPQALASHTGMLLVPMLSSTLHRCALEALRGAPKLLEHPALALACAAKTGQSAFLHALAQIRERAADPETQKRVLIECLLYPLPEACAVLLSQGFQCPAPGEFLTAFAQQRCPAGPGAPHWPQRSGFASISDPAQAALMRDKILAMLDKLALAQGLAPSRPNKPPAAL